MNPLWLSLIVHYCSERNERPPLLAVKKDVLFYAIMYFPVVVSHEDTFSSPDLSSPFFLLSETESILVV